MNFSFPEPVMFGDACGLSSPLKQDTHLAVAADLLQDHVHPWCYINNILLLNEVLASSSSASLDCTMQSKRLISSHQQHILEIFKGQTWALSGSWWKLSSSVSTFSCNTRKLRNLEGSVKDQQYVSTRERGQKGKWKTECFLYLCFSLQYHFGIFWFVR